MSKKQDASTIKLLGGRLGLDFVNTVDSYGCPDPGEYFVNYQDLVDWSRHVGILTASEAGSIKAAAAEHPTMAENVHRRAIELRQILYSIFCSAVAGAPPAQNDLAAFNDHLSQTMMHSQIVKVADGFIWDLTGTKTKLDWLLNPVIRSAADLLVSSELGKLKKCSDPSCGWLFLDISRNRSRRWCDMRGCGNRAKAKRYYKKKKPGRRRSTPARATPLPIVTESTTPRITGGLDFAAKGGKRQERKARQLLQEKPGKKRPAWKNKNQSNLDRHLL